MPIGYLWTVALVCLGVACALTRWPRLGFFSAIPALVVSELPFLAGYLLIASTMLALADGDLDSPAGAAGAVVALLALAGLVVIVRRALHADAALRNTGKPGRPWGRILRAPFFPGRLDVVRVRGLAYGDGPHRTLDVYHRRDRPAGAPILLHIHGGGFHSGNKAREARPLIRHLTSRRGFVCVSADYRLQPRVTLAGPAAGVKRSVRQEAILHAQCPHMPRPVRRSLVSAAWPLGASGDPSRVRVVLDPAGVGSCRSRRLPAPRWQIPL